MSAAGRVVGSARSSVRTTFGRGGAAEQDAEEVWRATVAAATDALSAARVPADSIVAVAASAQYSSIVPVDASCRPVGPMLTWMDQRASPGRLRAWPTGATSVRFPGRVRPLPAAPRPGPDLVGDQPQPHALDPPRRSRHLPADRDVPGARRLPDRPGHRPAHGERVRAFMQLLADSRRPERLALAPRPRRRLGHRSGEAARRWRRGTSSGLRTGSPPSSACRRARRCCRASTTPRRARCAAGAFRGDHAGLAIGTTAVIVADAPKKKLDPVRSMWTMPSPLGGGHLLSAENGVAGAAVEHFLDRVGVPRRRFGAAGERRRPPRGLHDAAAAAARRAASGVPFPPGSAVRWRRRPTAVSQGRLPRRGPRHHPSRPGPRRC